MIHAEQTCIFWRERTFFLKLTKFHVSPTKIDCWVGLRKIDAHTATAAIGVPLMTCLTLHVVFTFAIVLWCVLVHVEV